jgi:hypothetical protein
LKRNERCEEILVKKINCLHGSGEWVGQEEQEKKRRIKGNNSTMAGREEMDQEQLFLKVGKRR